MDDEIYSVLLKVPKGEIEVIGQLWSEHGETDQYPEVITESILCNRKHVMKKSDIPEFANWGH